MTSDLNDEVEKVLDEADITAGESPTAGPGGKPGPESADPDDTWTWTPKARGVSRNGNDDGRHARMRSVPRTIRPGGTRYIFSFARGTIESYNLRSVCAALCPKFLQHADLAGAAYFGFLALTTANAKLFAMKYYIQTKKAAEEAAQGVDQGGEPTHVGPIEAPLITPAARGSGILE